MINVSAFLHSISFTCVCVRVRTRVCVKFQVIGSPVIWCWCMLNKLVFDYISVSQASLIYINSQRLDNEETFVDVHSLSHLEYIWYTCIGRKKLKHSGKLTIYCTLKKPHIHYECDFFKKRMSATKHLIFLCKLRLSRHRSANNKCTRTMMCEQSWQCGSFVNVDILMVLEDGFNLVCCCL